MNPLLFFGAEHYAALGLFAFSCLGFGRLLFLVIKATPLSDPWMERGLSSAVGLGVFITLVQFLAIAGQLNAPAVLIITAAGLISSTALCKLPRFSSIRKLHASSIILIIGMALHTGLFPLRVPLNWDELAYHLPHAREWARTGHIVITDWLRYPFFPFNYDLLYAASITAVDDVMPHLLHAYAGWLTLLILHRWTFRAAGRAVACFAVIFLLVIIRPDFANAYIDMGVMLFIFAAFSCFLLWRENLENYGFLYISAFLIGVACGSKYQALTFVPLFAGATLLLTRRSQVLARCVGLILLPCAYWYIRNAYLTGDPFDPLGGKFFGFTDWNLGDYQRQLADIHANFGWPPSFLLLALLSPIALRHRLSRPHVSCAIVFSSYAFGVWLVTSHYPRYLMPAFPVLAALAAVGLMMPIQSVFNTYAREIHFKRSVTTGAWLVASIFFLGLVGIELRHAGNYQISVIAVTPVQRKAIVATAFPEYAGVINYFAKHTGRKIYQIGLEGVTYYLPHPIYGDHFGPWRYSDRVSLSPADLADFLKKKNLNSLVFSAISYPLILQNPKLNDYFELVYSDSIYHILNLRE